MAGETISFAELFEQQDATPIGLRVTAQPISDDAEHVKITPVDGDGNCWCSSALVIPVQSVATLRSTDDTALCCGKRLRVVEIEFADATLAAVVGQVHARAAAAPGPGQWAGPGVPYPSQPPGTTGASAPSLPRPLFEAIFTGPRTQKAWPTASCLAEWFACLALCGGYEGCAQICYDGYQRCIAAG